VERKKPQKKFLEKNEGRLWQKGQWIKDKQEIIAGPLGTSAPGKTNSCTTGKKPEAGPDCTVAPFVTAERGLRSKGFSSYGE